MGYQWGANPINPGYFQPRWGYPQPAAQYPYPYAYRPQPAFPNPASFLPHHPAIMPMPGQKPGAVDPAVLLQDPQIQAQLAQLQQMAQAGQISPEYMDQAMAALGFPVGATGKHFSLSKFLPFALIGSVLGVSVQSGAENILEQLMHTNGQSKLLKYLHIVDYNKDGQLRAGLSTFLDKLHQKGMVNFPHLPASRYLAYEGAYSPEQAVRNLMALHFNQTVTAGKPGFLYDQISKIPNLDSGLLDELRKATTSDRLFQLIKGDTKWFFPDNVRGTAMSALRRKNAFNQFMGKIFKLKTPQNLAELAEKCGIQAGERSAFYQYIQDGLNAAVKNAPTIGENTPLQVIAEAVSKNHILNAASESKGLLYRMTGGLIAQVKNIEKNPRLPNKGMFAAEHELYEQLVNATGEKAVGPIGRFLAKGLLYFHQMFSSKTIKGIPVAELAQLHSWPQKILGSLWANLVIFAWPLYATFRADKGTKVSTFTDNFASGLGGWLGFIAAKQLIISSGIMEAGGWIARFAAGKHFGINGSSILANLAALIVAPIVGFAFQKVANLFFGDPKKVKAKLEAKKAQAGQETENAESPVQKPKKQRALRPEPPMPQASLPQQPQAPMAAPVMSQSPFPQQPQMPMPNNAFAQTTQTPGLPSLAEIEFNPAAAEAQGNYQRSLGTHSFFQKTLWQAPVTY